MDLLVPILIDVVPCHKAPCNKLLSLVSSVKHSPSLPPIRIWPGMGKQWMYSTLYGFPLTEWFWHTRHETQHSSCTSDSGQIIVKHHHCVGWRQQQSWSTVKKQWVDLHYQNITDCSTGHYIAYIQWWGQAKVGSTTQKKEDHSHDLGQIMQADHGWTMQALQQVKHGVWGSRPWI